MPALCLTLAEPSLPRLESKLSHFVHRCDMVEVRLDYLDELRIPRLPESGRTRFLATCRPVREGGRYAGSENSRIRLLQQAAQQGFTWIDLEQDVPPIELPGPVRILRSHHNFDRFGDLEETWRELRSAGGDAAKLAVRVGSTSELVQLLRFMEDRPAGEKRVILGMGEYGEPSRVLGAFLGNSWTYVAASDEEVVAPGQFSLETAQSLFRLHAFDQTPDLFGVLGNPVEHSKSPLLHNALFRKHGMEALYLPLLLDDLNAWFEFLSASSLPFRGFSVTIPFKFSVARFCSQNHSPTSSVNTLSREDRRWIGRNTDYSGFLKPLQQRISSLAGRSALVLGNGGVARTVVAALGEAGVEVAIVGRDRSRVRERSLQWGCPGHTFDDLPLSADICVNTTPVGQHPKTEESPLEPEQIRFSLVYDLIYNPVRTRLLQLSEERGSETVSGIEMFLEQAAEQFEIWTGEDPDRNWMRSLLEER